MKKTKIVCTIGPASQDEETLRLLMEAGMNVCRLNFSHGNHEEHLERVNTIKKVRKELASHAAIMIDLKGPEIRTGVFENGGISVESGDKFILTTREVVGNQDIVSVSHEHLADDLQVGSRVLIDDGLVELMVEEILNGTDIVTRVVNYGEINDRKGINIPNTKVSLPSITNKDIEDILFGIENEVDFIAASFVRKAEDVIKIREILEKNGGDKISIISKIENEEGVDNLDEIIAASDGIMVARGDLGVEVLNEVVPLVQKEIIRKTNLAGKPVITATQMLDSMIRNPRPTRAEVNDVANAILDGSDAVMLSGETAAGKYPVESVEMMNRIAKAIEDSFDFRKANSIRSNWVMKDSTNVISKSVCQIAEQLNANAIIASTASGATAKAISKFRPNSTIVATTIDPSVARKLSLVWGVHPIIAKEVMHTDELIDRSIYSSLKSGLVFEGDLVVLTAGIPVGVGTSTNLIKLHTIGKVIMQGQAIGKGSVVGRVCKGSTPEELENKFRDGDILVAASTDADIVSYIEKSSGIIVAEGGLTSHAAIAAIHYKKPAIIGVDYAMSAVEDGDTITLDAISGIVYEGAAKVI